MKGKYLFLLLFLVYVLSSCTKEHEGDHVIFKGQAIDDKNGMLIVKGGLQVTGVYDNGSTWFTLHEEKKLGETSFDQRGQFNLSFAKWPRATGYVFWTRNPN